MMNSIVRQLIENVTVIDKCKIRIEFKGGFQIEQILNGVVEKIVGFKSA